MSGATLHLLCGKIASGKSTLAAALAAEPATVHFSEDTWLAALFGEEMKTGKDFVRFSARLRAAVGPHVVALLKAETSVVLDFQANTVESRRWMRELVDQSGANHQMHVLVADDALCLSRLKERNAGGAHAFAATEAQFHHFTKFFSPPSADEGFNIVEHVQNAPSNQGTV